MLTVEHLQLGILNCQDSNGNPSHILLMHVYPSAQLHANQADKVFYRVDDKSPRLMYAKGERYFEDIPVRDATVNDIDLDFVREYTAKIGYGKGSLEYLRGNSRNQKYVRASKP